MPRNLWQASARTSGGNGAAEPMAAERAGAPWERTFGHEAWSQPSHLQVSQRARASWETFPETGYWPASRPQLEDVGRSLHPSQPCLVQEESWEQNCPVRPKGLWSSQQLPVQDSQPDPLSWFPLLPAVKLYWHKAFHVNPFPPWGGSVISPFGAQRQNPAGILLKFVFYEWLADGRVKI